MPGAFAHMIAAEEAGRKIEERGLNLPTLAVNRFPQWLQAGAVGPDYPYLHHLLSSHDKSDSWADLLHYTRTGDVIRAGVGRLRQDFLTVGGQSSFLRALAWLYGYASHVVLDASIHPVVRAIVGEYEQNKTEHRACEMYMDSWIYKQTYDVELINTEWADYLRALNDPASGEMDSEVTNLWQSMLEQVYPEEVRSNPPLIKAWHKAYIDKIDAVDLNVGFFRHAAAQSGIVYIASSDIQTRERRKYIDSPKIPVPNKFGQQTMNYAKVFAMGVENVVRYWVEITHAIEGPGDPLLATLPNWNLDKGTIDEIGDDYATLWA
jgi:hypothetical protein